MELVQADAQLPDPCSCLTPANCQCTFVATRDGEIRSQRMIVGVRQQPVRMVFGALEIADPKEDLRSPLKSPPQAPRDAPAFGLFGPPPAAFRSLRWVALQPQVPCQGNTDQDVMIQP